MIPNILTGIRVVLVAPLLWCVAKGGPDMMKAAAIIFLVAGFTDFLDGQAARRLKQTSMFGSMFDLVADRLLMSPTLIFMLILGVFEGTKQYFLLGPTVYVVMVVFVDMNVFVGIYLFLRLRKVEPDVEFPTPTPLAKANFPFQISVVFFALLMGKERPLVASIFMWATMLTTPLAYITYMKKGSFVFNRAFALVLKRPQAPPKDKKK
jgi:phosphatidylglycerophosphate synthase